MGLYHIHISTLYPIYIAIVSIKKKDKIIFRPAASADTPMGVDQKEQHWLAGTYEGVCLLLKLDARP